jgi:ubiquitin-like protein Pup
MAEHESGQARATKRGEQDEATEAEAQDAALEDVKERHEKLGDDVDDILDEIDEVLESNAEEFVKGYVQKGGE